MPIIETVLEPRVIVFMDVHNFTQASRVLGDDLADFVQEMYETIGDAMVKHHGEIIKYIGDAVLGLFPAGAEIEAVRCGREVRQAFAALVKRRGLPEETELETGISSGTVVIGLFGHRSLRQKDVFGAAVSQAAVIGHHRGIAVTGPVREVVKTTFQTRALPPGKLKFLDEAMELWEVVD